MFDRGELEDPVAQQCHLPIEKVVAGRRNGLAVLTGSRSVAHGAGDLNTLGSCFRALVLGTEPLGPDTSSIFLVTSVPLLSSPIGWSQVPFSSTSEKVGELSVREP